MRFLVRCNPLSSPLVLLVLRTITAITGNTASSPQSAARHPHHNHHNNRPTHTYASSSSNNASGGQSFGPLSVIANVVAGGGGGGGFNIGAGPSTSNVNRSSGKFFALRGVVCFFFFVNFLCRFLVDCVVVFSITSKLLNHGLLRGGCTSIIPFYYTIYISSTIIIASHQRECSMNHQNICILLETYVTHPMNINHSLPHHVLPFNILLVSEYADTTFLFFVFMLLLLHDSAGKSHCKQHEKNTN